MFNAKQQQIMNAWVQQFQGYINNDAAEQELKQSDQQASTEAGNEAVRFLEGLKKASKRLSELWRAFDMSLLKSEQETVIQVWLKDYDAYVKAEDALGRGRITQRVSRNHFDCTTQYLDSSKTMELLIMALLG